MPPKRRIDPASGRAALTEWAANPDAAPRPVLATAVRYLLEELSIAHPGGSVEVRIPPFGVGQLVEGLRHTRGTPPNVVETDAQTFLRLASGDLGWDEALAAGRVSVSGTRADLSSFLPLF
ncbi:sterol carrier family protein [Falsarthrobacter nasiphocae]|uniref:Bacterial SCP orthologue domain-containing protein n=1 Tax=Falsarthrobacter nasiphocae TaxID=189863 RepID=A0AAE4C5G8_9MICC|nr:sterol carrier family protein [Falsarthrobacter nasiphocae]MDR6892326.1 hypothetical protein [Falsarthrobacter nasiphocae]